MLKAVDRSGRQLRFFRRWLSLPRSTLTVQREVSDQRGSHAVLRMGLCSRCVSLHRHAFKIYRCRLLIAPSSSDTCENRSNEPNNE